MFQRGNVRKYRIVSQWQTSNNGVMHRQFKSLHLPGDRRVKDRFQVRIRIVRWSMMMATYLALSGVEQSGGIPLRCQPLPEHRVHNGPGSALCLLMDQIQFPQLLSGRLNPADGLQSMLFNKAHG